VNIDRGICVASNAMSTISLKNQLLHFSFNKYWSNISHLLPVSDSPSNNLDKNDPVWKKFEDSSWKIDFHLNLCGGNQ
jgi:hypothetical protein